MSKPRRRHRSVLLQTPADPVATNRPAGIHDECIWAATQLDWLLARKLGLPLHQGDWTPEQGNLLGRELDLIAVEINALVEARQHLRAAVSA